jgi:predicted nucleic acid-binding protein
MAARQVKIALDSSFLIALVCDWHDHHPRTVRSYQHWLDRDSQIVIPAHAILECYSVLTRIPAPYRLPADIARDVIEGNFAQRAAIVGIKAGAIWDLLNTVTRHGVGGGQVYDALIAWCAVEAGATVLLTWNRKHFASIVPPDLEVREP